jgi:hypothetical protein
MKYVKTFNESEETLIGDLDQLGLESMKGWILALQQWNYDDVESYFFYLCITAPNIYAAVEQMMIGVGGEDIEIEPEEVDKYGFNVVQKIADMTGEITILAAWEGLIPKGKTSDSVQINQVNPFSIISELETNFSNVSAILRQSPEGNI